MQRTLWVGVLALTCFSSFVQACSVCGCGDPIESISSGLPLAGRLRLGLGWESLSTRATTDDDPNRRETLDQLIYQVELGWDPFDQLSLMARLPYNEKHNAAFGGASDNESSVSTGIGDLILGGRWALLSDRSPEARNATWLALGGGLSINTGANNVQDANGQRIDEHAQPGTGAVGPFAGLQIGLERAEWTSKMHLDAQVRATNAAGYKYGDAIRAGLGVYGESFGIVSLGFGIEGRYADYDRNFAAGILVENSGGMLLNLVPSLGLRLSSEAGVNFKAQLPVYQSLFGDQTIGPDFSISTQFLFM